MNSLIYTFYSCEREGEWFGDAETGHSLCQMLNAEVWIDGDSESPEPVSFLIWDSFSSDEGKPESEPFSEKTAIALRDFLNFCFPLDGKRRG